MNLVAHWEIQNIHLHPPLQKPYLLLEKRSHKKLPPNLIAAFQAKLDLINAAHEIQDLKIPPGNKLEKLKGGLKDFYSIRVNQQFRIIIKWASHEAYAVEIIDYH